ncbi:retrovirus-related pol polyprotein from transposon TNT 1-94 [Tanacetum coccineum]
MLLEGFELTKEDHESQLYNDFEHFRQNKGETIHDYYVRFTKLINDMRNIKMTMPRMQLNSKFLNNMLPEWGRFVTTVKLNRGLKESNYDQLYAYLKQHEAHANENKMMVVVQNVQGRQNRGQENNPRDAGAAGNGGVQNRDGNANPGQARQIKCYNCNGIGHITRNCTQPKRLQNSDYFKDKMLLMQSQENGVVSDEEQLLFLTADECDAFDSNVDEAPIAQTMFMANLSSADPVYDEASPSYDSNILFEVHEYDNYQDAVCEHHDAHEMHHDNKVVKASLTAELAIYKEQVELFERQAKKHDEIKQKNLLIINDNLIVDCLSKEVFYIATNSELTVSRFTEMHDAHTVIQARCLELEAELSKLRDKVLKDDHT